jgi:hypothetical protein
MLLFNPMESTVAGSTSAASAPASLVGLWNNPKLPGRVARYASCPHHPGV